MATISRGDPMRGESHKTYIVRHLPDAIAYLTSEIDQCLSIPTPSLPGAKSTSEMGAGPLCGVVIAKGNKR